MNGENHRDADKAKTPEAGDRIVRASDGIKLRPLYPASRLLKSAAAKADRIIRDRESMLEHAAEEAERIVAQAHTESERIREQAAVDAEKATKRRIARSIDELAKIGPAIEAKLAAEADRIALKIARTLLNAELKARPGLVEPFVIDAITAAAARGNVTVALHPDAAEHFAQDPRFIESERITVTADPNLQRGDVRVSTDLGEVLDSIESRLDELERKALQTSQSTEDTA